jgi:hypothetical protein
MSIITERRVAPPTPEEPISDSALEAMLKGTEEEPDEIVYEHPMATFTTTRAEREKAAQIWKDEGQVDYPDNAEESLRRTEAMLRLRLKMGPREYGSAVHDLVRLHRDHLPMPRLEHQAAQPELPRFDEPTGDFTPEAIERERQRQLEIPTGEFTPIEANPQLEKSPVPPVRPSRLRAPLRHIVRNKLRRQHAA